MSAAGISYDNIVEGSRKRARLSENASATPGNLVKLRKPKAKVVDTREGGRKLLDVIMTAVDESDNTLLCANFLALPNRRQWPDYYSIIKRPLTFEDIRFNLEQGSYSSFEDMKHDCEVVCMNAKRFNAKESEIWTKAKHMHALIRNTYEDIVDPSSDAEEQQDDKSGDTSTAVKPTRPRITLRPPRAVQATKVEDNAGSYDPEEEEEEEDDEPDADGNGDGDFDEEEATERIEMDDNGVPVTVRYTKDGKVDKRDLRGETAKQLYVQLRKQSKLLQTLTGENGQLLCEWFMTLPDKTLNKDYYTRTKKPISFTQINIKLVNRRYHNLHGLVKDLTTMLDNAISYNEEGSDVIKDALQMKEHIDKVMIPNLIADGFTLDPNDKRQFVMPPDAEAIKKMPKHSEAYKILIARIEAAKQAEASISPEPSSLKVKVRTGKGGRPDSSLSAARDASPPMHSRPHRHDRRYSSHAGLPMAASPVISPPLSYNSPFAASGEPMLGTPMPFDRHQSGQLHSTPASSYGTPLQQYPSNMSLRAPPSQYASSGLNPSSNGQEAEAISTSADPPEYKQVETPPRLDPYRPPKVAGLARPPVIPVFSVKAAGASSGSYLSNDLIRHHVVKVGPGAHDLAIKFALRGVLRNETADADAEAEGSYIPWEWTVHASLNGEPLKVKWTAVETALAAPGEGQGTVDGKAGKINVRGPALCAVDVHFPPHLFKRPKPGSQPQDSARIDFWITPNPPLPELQDVADAHPEQKYGHLPVDSTPKNSAARKRAAAAAGGEAPTVQQSTEAESIQRLDEVYRIWLVR